MKFVCTRDNFLHGLQIISGLTTKSNNLPILSHVLISATEAGVEIVSTNLEIAIRAQVRAKTEVVGMFTVPAKVLLDYIGLIREEQIEVSLSGSEILIHSGSNSTKIKGTTAEEYPVIPDVQDGTSYSVDAVVLRDALSQVVFSAAKNEIRPELSGIYMGYLAATKKLTFAATDSYRLSERQLGVEQGGGEDQNCILPGRTVAELVRLLSFALQEEGETQVRLTISENQLRVRYETFELTSRLIDGHYPDYRQIIPSQFKTTTVCPVEVMVNAIKAASLFSVSGVNAITFSISPEKNGIVISSTSTQAGEHTSTIESDVLGEENTIVLNFRYVLDGISHLGGSDVEFKMNDSETPCVFKSKDSDDYLYIVMPIRQ